MATLLDTVKLAARIKHNTLDSEITRLIAWARAEMERAGVPADIAASDNELVTECAIQGVLMHISTDEKIRDAAERSFLYQLDNMRKRAEWPEPNPEPDGGEPSDP